MSTGTDEVIGTGYTDYENRIEAEMDYALRSGQFKIYLQPKVNMVTSKIYGAEALSRWIHPKEGLRTPDKFIPLFERNGFICKLDMYVYEEVCKMKQRWVGKKYEHIPVSVNMSRMHLKDAEFPHKLKRIADKYNVSIEELEIEVTEGIFVDDMDSMLKALKTIKDYGFLISIDDFGSGFSALNMLKDLEVDTIKIDKEFLRESTDNSRGKRVVKSVISMCRDLKFDVVTEGVETGEQAKFVTSCGCQIAQGFYYSKPVTIPEFEMYAQEHLIHTLSSYSFRFDGSLESEDGSMTAFISGEGLEFQQGIYEDSKSIHFPGGIKETNTIHIPYDAIVNDSFTVAMWIKPEVHQDWSAAIYIKFESGFASIVPHTDTGLVDYRIRDSREVSGWYDTASEALPVGQWSHVAITYNAKTEDAVLYVNGQAVGTMVDVPTNRFVKWIILGGDVFQPSFIGNICELVIFNEAKSEEFIKKQYEDYGI